MWTRFLQQEFMHALLNKDERNRPMYIHCNKGKVSAEWRHQMKFTIAVPAIISTELDA